MTWFRSGPVCQDFHHQLPGTHQPQNHPSMASTCLSTCTYLTQYLLSSWRTQSPPARPFHHHQHHHPRPISFLLHGLRLTAPPPRVALDHSLRLVAPRTTRQQQQQQQQQQQPPESLRRVPVPLELPRRPAAGQHSLRLVSVSSASSSADNDTHGAPATTKPRHLRQYDRGSFCQAVPGGAGRAPRQAVGRPRRGPSELSGAERCTSIPFLVLTLVVACSRPPSQSPN